MIYDGSAERWLIERKGRSGRSDALAGNAQQITLAKEIGRIIDAQLITGAMLTVLWDSGSRLCRFRQANLYRI